MKIYRIKPHDYGDTDFYSLTPLPSAEEMECDSVVYVLHHYRTDVVKAGSSYDDGFYKTEESAKRECDRHNKLYAEDEYCNWRCTVELKPVFN